MMLIVLLNLHTEQEAGTLVMVSIDVSILYLWVLNLSIYSRLIKECFELM